MTSSAVRGWITLVFVLLAAYGAYSCWRVYQLWTGSSRPAEIDSADSPPRPVRPLSDFTFTERSGQRLSLKSLQGEIWVASFFFTGCPGFCLQMNREVAALQEELADTGVRFVSITVDPDNDTPDELVRYADRLHADPQRWLFLTGRFSDVRELGQDVFKVSVADKQQHSDRLILIDRQGKVQGRYSALDSAQVRALVRKLKELLPADGRSTGT